MTEKRVRAGFLNLTLSRTTSLGLVLLAALGVLFSAGGPISRADDRTPTPVPTLGPYTPLEGHVLGPDGAPLTIIMYGDFQCALCARYARDLETIRALYPAEIRLIWRHLPDLRTHDKAALAVQATEAAAAQGRFWEMHDQLFTHQDEWITLPPEEFPAVLSQYAGIVGLEVGRFDGELAESVYAGIIDAALRDAADLELVGAPLLLFNGLPFSGRDDLFGLEEAARFALLEQRQFDTPPPMTLDLSQSYRATLLTDKGSIVIDLYDDLAPVAVNNFVFLARSGWYDGMTFHYVLPGLVAQTGDPSDTGRGTPGYTIPDEHDNGLRFDREGLVAMAQPADVPDSAGSIFFFTLAPLEQADGQYTIFGGVVEGMDVLHSLTPRNANDPVNFPTPLPGDRVISVTVEEFG